MSRYGEIALWQFINILSEGGGGGAGSAQDLPPHISDKFKCGTAPCHQIHSQNPLSYLRYYANCDYYA